MVVPLRIAEVIRRTSEGVITRLGINPSVDAHCGRAEFNRKERKERQGQAARAERAAALRSLRSLRLIWIGPQSRSSFRAELPRVPGLVRRRRAGNQVLP